MAQINPVNVLRLLLDDYDLLEETPVNEQELELRDRLQGIIESYLKFSDLLDDEDDIVEETEITAVTVPSAERPGVLHMPKDPTYVPPPEPPKTIDLVDFNYKKKVVEYWKSGRKGKALRFKTVQWRFKRVKNLSTLYQWARDLERCGSRIDKLAKINKKTLEEFTAAQQRGIMVKGKDMQRWALAANEVIGLSDFKASSSWLLNFKKANGIHCPKTNAGLSFIPATEETEQLQESENKQIPQNVNVQHAVVENFQLPEIDWNPMPVANVEQLQQGGMWNLMPLTSVGLSFIPQ